MAEDAMLQLSTAPQLPKGQTHDDADDRRSGIGRRDGEGLLAMAGRAATDVNRLSFGLQMVLTIVGVVTAAYGASWQAQASQREAMAELRSDVRDIRTTMQHQKELAAKDSIMWEERFATMKEKAVADEELRRVLLKQYEQSNTDFQKKMLSR